MKNKSAKPFVKWAGGKYKLANDLKKLIHKKFDIKKNTYFEPMVGSGGFYFNLAPHNAYLSDINQNLITTYNSIKTDVKALIKKLEEHQKNHNKDYFYEMRDKYNEIKDVNTVDVASLFIYLNRTCFNGLYRENSNGKFNVPIGSYKNPTICDSQNLLKVNKNLQNVNIECHGYEQIINHIKKGDFIYIDPPYIPLDPTSFTKYSKDDFGIEDHNSLSNFCDELDKLGAYYMLSNSDTELTEKIYFKINEKNGQFLIFEDEHDNRFSDKFLVSRTIASKAEKREKAKEVVITNYKI
tara:strand:- start:811 stop:1698 length:888 start_codon:yes stop_codon:yes gene_type:complete